MADVTNVFKAVVKTLKSRHKLEGGAKDADNLKSSIFPASKLKGDFETKAKDLVGSITKLRDFLFEHRKEYISTGCHLSTETSTMTDAERDQIDDDAQKIIRQCRETINFIKEKAQTQVVHPQVKEHRFCVLKLVEEYLKVVCKVYSEQKAVRVKRVVDRKRISKLEPENHMKQRRIDMKFSSLEPKEDTNQSSTESSRSKVALEEKSQFSEDEEISAEDAQMFERENQALFDEMSSLSAEVSQIEGKVLEIAKLQEVFTEKVLEQRQKSHLSVKDLQSMMRLAESWMLQIFDTREKDIDHIEQNIVGATENIKDANEEIREAMKNSAGFRVYILFFLLVCTLSLLFLDWYNG